MPPLTAEQALAAAAAFGLDVAGARAVPLPGGYSNEIVRIDTPVRSYVLRRYGQRNVSRHAIRFEHAVAAHAAARIGEVVAPLRDPEGTTLRDSAELGAHALYPFVPGETGRRDPATGAAAARVLARFHRAVRDVHVAGGMRSARFLGTLPWLRARFLRWSADPLLERALDWSALIVAVGTAATHVAPRAAALPHVVVHGDPNPDNVVTAGAGEVRGLIDLDFAHETERIADVGALLDAFAREGEDAPLALERIAPLVEAYAAEAPLAAAERAAVADAMLRRAAGLVFLVVSRHGARRPGDVGGAPRYAARVAEIAAARAEIEAAAGG